MTDGNAEMSRRAFLATAAGTTAAAGAAGTAAAQETGTSTGTGSGGGGSGTGTGSGGGTGTSGGGGGGGGGGGTETVAVGPNGDFVFTPGTSEALQILPGTTVEFVWESDNHNIVADSQPEGANWSGHEPIENSGFTYSHTFGTLGTYEYYCQPHQSAGMVGTIEVVESISTPAPSSVPSVPDSAKTLGIATTFAMVATMGLAFFFLKYGGDYEFDEE
ncbi:plastocyanin/azurin family copper-binding protein [Halogeometricum sp. S1BR25-6]|uniref:Plastocyanin/azurin family copper-binding protein n=1 Tax=Halogeometricum salsisoli TaxID=2950536 RepID=A0ABU2GD02_9EURY|nr:plastocyanin/azurin family copper-binding protein [Halogeometricum sp. S1BR25-6]MDS0298138.1 plastocyanin/azurin family copper-binding protein [Halogeometricum sp. S1BR25-6]